MMDKHVSHEFMGLTLTMGDRIEIVLKPKHKKYVKSDHLRLRGQFIESKDEGNNRFMFIKLDSGYNAGFSIDRIVDLFLLERSLHIEPKPDKKARNQNKRPIVLISTGGTIASRVDYGTGAVYPPQRPDDMISWINDPEIMKEVQPIISMSKLSEDMVPDDWMRIALIVVEAFDGGAHGCVITHGTDTLSYTACALSFLLRGLPGPVVLTGSQRSSDRPSTDAHQNLIDAIKVARVDGLREVCVVMHGDGSDGESHIHLGSRVRKMHTSRRDAFHSINHGILGIVKDGRVEIFPNIESKDDHSDPRIVGGFDGSVHLLKYQPQLDPSTLELIADHHRCIVLEGTGLGHVRSDLADPIENVIKRGVPVIMTSSCISGMVNMNVYSTGRRLLGSGVIPAYDMHPETAMIKAMYVLNAFGKDLDKDGMEGFKNAFLEDISGELSYRTSISDRSDTNFECCDHGSGGMT